MSGPTFKLHFAIATGKENFNINAFQSIYPTYKFSCDIFLHITLTTRIRPISKLSFFCTFHKKYYFCLHSDTNNIIL